MEDNLNKPSSQESPDLQVKLEDNISFISHSPSFLSLPLSESKDNVCVQQETPDPPVLEFDVPVLQESLTPPPLHFDRLRSLSVHIHEESTTPPPLLFDCPAQKRRASDDQERNSEGETAGKDGEDQRHVEEEDEQHATESEEAWEEELNKTLTPNAEI